MRAININHRKVAQGSKVPKGCHIKANDTHVLSYTCVHNLLHMIDRIKKTTSY